MQIMIERGKVWNFDELPPNSIALDGAVQGPRLDLDKNVLSFDHHDGCIRLVTSATCRQVLDALLLGLDPTPYTVYVNDIDGDTVLSVWLLQNPKLAQLKNARDLVEVVSTMDAHGPAYPVRDRELSKFFYDGVMAPERDARQNRTYGTCDLEALLSLCLTRVSDLILHNYVEGGVEVRDKRTFTIEHTGKGYVVATSNFFIFDLLYEAGHSAALAYQNMGDKGYAYTIGKKSDLVQFPVKRILNALNEVEPGWGGGSTIGGAPRHPDGSRSRLTPQKVIAIIETVVG